MTPKLMYKTVQLHLTRTWKLLSYLTIMIISAYFLSSLKVALKRILCTNRQSGRDRRQKKICSRPNRMRTLFTDHIFLLLIWFNHGLWNNLSENQFLIFYKMQTDYVFKLCNFIRLHHLHHDQTLQHFSELVQEMDPQSRIAQPLVNLSFHVKWSWQFPRQL